MRILAVLLAVALIACSTLHPRQLLDTADARAGGPVVFVVKRSWHTDIGFSAADLPPPLAALAARWPDSQYRLFGFGDRHYLINRHHGVGELLGALWPGPGVILLTTLSVPPERAFDPHGVIRLRMSPEQMRRLTDFIWRSLATSGQGPQELGPGPYDGSDYYAASQRYSALHTCNTWTAEALRAAGLPVHSFGVELAGQVWHQVRSIPEQ